LQEQFTRSLEPPSRQLPKVSALSSQTLHKEQFLWPA
jgi:hypothetical protein